jgi:hypothetical protein
MSSYVLNFLYYISVVDGIQPRIRGEIKTRRIKPNNLKFHPVTAKGLKIFPVYNHGLRQESAEIYCLSANSIFYS